MSETMSYHLYRTSWRGTKRHSKHLGTYEELAKAEAKLEREKAKKPEYLGYEYELWHCPKHIEGVT